MPVDTKHSEYQKYQSQWQKCRDVVEGQEKVHQEGQNYLPKLGGQTDKEYTAYVNRALFYNASQRTIDAMTGLLFRKDPVYKFPSGLESYVDDIDLQGNSLETFVQELSDEILEVGRYGILVDMPAKNANIITQYDAVQAKLRPYLCGYKTEDIINWSVVKKQLVLLVLRETYEEQTSVDEFKHNCKIQYRVLDIIDGKYRQRLFKESADGKEHIWDGEEIFPVKSGKPFTSIPFFFINSKDLRPTVEKPPFIDLINVNLSHYLTCADLEHGSHYTALPTAVITGHRMDTDGDTFRIGSSEAWVFTEADADAKYLEFTGQGLQHLITLKQEKEQMMAALGARMLASEKAAAETAETHLIKRQGENSALASIASNISAGIKGALGIMAEWGNAGQSGQIVYELNTDYIPTPMSPQDLTALLQTWQAGGMAFPDFLWALQKGEIIRPDRTAEEIQAETEVEQMKVLEQQNAITKTNPNEHSVP